MWYIHIYMILIQQEKKNYMNKMQEEKLIFKLLLNIINRINLSSDVCLVPEIMKYIIYAFSI